MIYTSEFLAPIGKLTLTADEESLLSISFGDDSQCLEEANADSIILKSAEKWLTAYFSGEIPSEAVPFSFNGTDFQNEVWQIVADIPYGQTVTYGEIARKIAKSRGIKRMSSQAVGNAIGKNKLPIIIPCHRVIGSDGKLVGYSGGIDKKIFMLKLEGIIR